MTKLVNCKNVNKLISPSEDKFQLEMEYSKNQEKVDQIGQQETSSGVGQ